MLWAEGLCIVKGWDKLALLLVLHAVRCGLFVVYSAAERGGVTVERCDRSCGKALPWPCALGPSFLVQRCLMRPSRRKLLQRSTEMRHTV